MTSGHSVDFDVSNSERISLVKLSIVKLNIIQSSNLEPNSANEILDICIIWLEVTFI